MVIKSKPCTMIFFLYRTVTIAVPSVGHTVGPIIDMFYGAQEWILPRKHACTSFDRTQGRLLSHVKFHWIGVVWHKLTELKSTHFFHFLNPCLVWPHWPNSRHDSPWHHGRRKWRPAKHGINFDRTAHAGVFQQTKFSKKFNDRKIFFPQQTFLQSSMEFL